MDEEKLVQISKDLSSEDDIEEVKKELSHSVSEYKKVKRLIDYFILGMFLVLVMYLHIY